MTPRNLPPTGPISTLWLAPQVLVVDNDAAVSDLLRSTLQEYEVVAAASGAEALTELGRRRFAVMLCDVTLGEGSGIDLIDRSLELEPDLAIVMLSANDDAASARGALLRGAVDYLVKPADPGDIRIAVRRALAGREARIRDAYTQRLVHDRAACYAADLEAERRARSSMSGSIISALVNAIEARDLFLHGHCQRVAELSARIGTLMGLQAEMIDALHTAGQLHDVGKLGLRDALVDKTEPLTPAEHDQVKQHVAIGLQILAPLDHLGSVLTYVHQHHERWDGSGYPNGLFGEQISLGGRILAAADTFDALTSRRPYRQPMGPMEALAYLQGTTHLDPGVLGALRRTVRHTPAFGQRRIA